jgi:hypothetical protein
MNFHIGPVRQFVRGEDNIPRRYLVIFPGTAETTALPFKSKGSSES